MSTCVAAGRNGSTVVSLDPHTAHLIRMPEELTLSGLCLPVGRNLATASGTRVRSRSSSRNLNQSSSMNMNIIPLNGNRRTPASSSSATPVPQPSTSSSTRRTRASAGGLVATGEGGGGGGYRRVVMIDSDVHQSNGGARDSPIEIQDESQGDNQIESSRPRRLSDRIRGTSRSSGGLAGPSNAVASGSGSGPNNIEVVDQEDSVTEDEEDELLSVAEDGEGDDSVHVIPPPVNSAPRPSTLASRPPSFLPSPPLQRYPLRQAEVSEDEDELLGNSSGSRIQPQLSTSNRNSSGSSIPIFSSPSSSSKPKVSIPTSNSNSNSKGKGKVPPEIHHQLLSTYSCPICFSPPNPAVTTPCGHVFCGGCLFSALRAYAVSRAPALGLRQAANFPALLNNVGPIGNLREIVNGEMHVRPSPDPEDEEDDGIELIRFGQGQARGNADGNGNGNQGGNGIIPHPHWPAQQIPQRAPARLPDGYPVAVEPNPNSNPQGQPQGLINSMRSRNGRAPVAAAQPNVAVPARLPQPPNPQAIGNRNANTNGNGGGQERDYPDPLSGPCPVCRTPILNGFNIQNKEVGSKVRGLKFKIGKPKDPQVRIEEERRRKEDEERKKSEKSGKGKGKGKERARSRGSEEGMDENRAVGSGSSFEKGKKRKVDGVKLEDDEDREIEWDVGFHGRDNEGSSSRP